MRRGFDSELRRQKRIGAYLVNKVGHGSRFICNIPYFSTDISGSRLEFFDEMLVLGQISIYIQH